MFCKSFWLRFETIERDRRLAEMHRGSDSFWIYCALLAWYGTFLGGLPIRIELIHSSNSGVSSISHQNILWILPVLFTIFCSPQLTSWKVFHQLLSKINIWKVYFINFSSMILTYPIRHQAEAATIEGGGAHQHPCWECPDPGFLWWVTTTVFLLLAWILYSQAPPDILTLFIHII